MAQKIKWLKDKLSAVCTVGGEVQGVKRVGLYRRPDPVIFFFTNCYMKVPGLPSLKSYESKAKFVSLDIFIYPESIKMFKVLYCTYN